MFVLEDKIVPYPTLIVENKDIKHRAHFLYELNTPILLFDNAHNKPKEFAADVEHGLTNLLGADDNFNNVFIKNPNSNEFTVFDTGFTYDLAELNEYIVNKPAKKVEKYCSLLSRNCYLFDKGRFWSYNNILLYENFSQFFADVFEKIHIENSKLSTMLSDKEIGYIAKSIATWTWKNRYRIRGSKFDVGAVKDFYNGDWKALSDKEKKQQGAYYCHSKQRQETEKKIISAIALLKSKNERITKTAVAQILGLSREKIGKNYSYLF